MSLADRTPRGPKVLTIDLERVPGRVELDIWEGRDLARINYIHPDRWKSLPMTVCWSAKWHHQDRMMFGAAWQRGGTERMLHRAWSLLNEADIVVGFNSRKADHKWLNGEWVQIGYGPPSPYKTVDLYVVSKREFAFESKSLRHLCQRLDLEDKDGHYDADEARAAVAGNREAQRRIRSYNEQDVRITEQAYNELGPWIKDHPNVGVYNGKDRCCFRCGSEDLKQHGFTGTALTQYALLQCAECGAWTRLNHRKHSVTTRAAR